MTDPACQVNLKFKNKITSYHLQLTIYNRKFFSALGHQCL